MWTGEDTLDVAQGAETALARNFLLRSLPQRDLERLSPFLEKVTLTPRRVLQHAGVPIEHLYFVEDALVSVLASTDERNAVEVRLIGREGAVGSEAVLGVNVSPLRHFVQLGGSALRISVADLNHALAEMPLLRAVFNTYLHDALMQSSQSAACSLSHSLVQRLSRWLLTAQDRSDKPELAITQDLLARSLGVRRASVSDALKPLEGSGIFARERGLIRILDRARLEQLACRCYRVMRGGRQAPGHTKTGRWPLFLLSLLALLEIECLAQ
jgi:CRP-like cAMP-binding protein